MTTPSGQIAASDINIELGRSSTNIVVLNGERVRRLADRTSGTISYSDLQNKNRTRTYDSGQVAPSRTRSDSAYNTNFVASGGSYYVPAYRIGASYNVGALDVDVYDTTAYANATVQTQNMTVTVGLTYDSSVVNAVDTNIAIVPATKPVGYPSSSVTDYGNQNGLLSIASGFSGSGARIKTGTMSLSYSLSTPVSFGSVGGWSIGTTGQWNTGKISRTDHFISIGMNVTIGFGNSQPIFIHYAQISGSYSI